MKMEWLCACLIGLAASQLATAGDWSRFRGPNGVGVVADESVTFPTSFDSSDFAWKTTLPGRGHGSPVIVGEKAFLISATEKGAWRLSCLDTASGKILWSSKASVNPYRKHRYNSFASCTPAVDADRVYAILPSIDAYAIVAYDHSGKLVWKKALGEFSSQHGPGVSPVIYRGKVIIANDHLGKAGLYAFDGATGKQLWHLSRNPEKTAYSTPAVWTDPAGRELLIFNSQGNGIAAIDPVDGAFVWGTSTDVFKKRSVASPIVAGGLIIGSCGSGGGGNYLIAVKPPASGTLAEVAYTIRKSVPYVPTPVAHGELLFLVSDGGIGTCVEAATGKTIWRERLPGDYFGSPVIVNGVVHVINREGEVIAFEANKTFKLLGKSPLGELSYATPAIAGGKVYLRTENHLVKLK